MVGLVGARGLNLMYISTLKCACLNSIYIKILKKTFLHLILGGVDKLYYMKIVNKNVASFSSRALAYIYCIALGAL